MTAGLPELAYENFVGRLPRGTAEPVARRLFLHYELLRRWAARMALVAQSTAEDVVERHYAESLAAVDLLPPEGRLVDIGSGAGFPGLVLAAARPELEVCLFERRQKKAAFLRAAARAMSLEVDVFTDSVGRRSSLGPVENVDCLTARAIRFEPAEWEQIGSRLGPEGSVLLWCGAQDVEIPGLRVRATRRLAGGDQRRIVEYEKVNKA